MKKLLSTIIPSILLCACGGGSGSGGGSDSGITNTTSKVSVPPANVELTNVSSTSTSIIKATWSPVTDGSTSSSNMKYELHASLDENFSPSSATIVGTSVGNNALSLNPSTLKPGNTYFIKIVAINKEGLSTTSKSKSLKIAETMISPSKATMNAATTFTITGVELEDGINFQLDGCKNITEIRPSDNDKFNSSSVRKFSCVPTNSDKNLMNGKLTTTNGNKFYDFSVVTATSTVGLELKNLGFTRQKVQLARVPVNLLSGMISPAALLLQCSKTEMKRTCVSADVPETKCESHTYTDDFGFTFPTAPSCTTTLVRHDACTDLPVLSIGDQEFNAYATVTTPVIPTDINTIKSNASQIIEDNLKNAIINHVSGAANQFKNDIQACAVKAGAVAITTGVSAAAATEGAAAPAAASAALPAFMEVFTPCTNTAIDAAIVRLENVEDISEAFINETKKDLETYVHTKIDELKPVIEFDSQCVNWHPV